MSDTISRNISEIENISNLKGLDISLDVDSDNESLEIRFTKTSNGIQDDDALVEECREFIYEVMIPLVMKHESTGSVNVDVSEDSEDKSIIYINMVLPLSEYIVESFKTYVMIAHSVDSFLNL